MEQILEFLTESGKNILSYCISDDKENFVKLIQKQPELLNFPRIYEIACQHRSINLVKHFWRFGLPIDLFIIPVLCLQGQLDMVKFFTINYDISKVNWVPLITCASKSGNLELVKYLIYLGFDPTENENSAIRTAAFEGHYDIVKFLLNFGVDINCNKNYIFRIACEHGHVELVELLLENNFDLLADKSVGMSLAAINGRNEVLQILALKGLDLRSDNFAAFYFAIKSDKLETLTFLIDLVGEEHVKYEIILGFIEKVKKITEQDPINCRLFLQSKLKILSTIEFPLDILPSDVCPVCFQPVSLILSCRHSICLSCFQSLRDKNCPLCRYPIDKNLIKRK
uniref:RING-type domain-containing protein n=1 Tax=viral metagenome TaxID=1070528 RepID=A0A6C0KUJ9_9ZZZZ